MAVGHALRKPGLGEGRRASIAAFGAVSWGDDVVPKARAVLAVPDHDGRRKLARDIVRKGMSVRDAERAARWAGAKKKPRRQAAPLDPALVARAKAAADRITGFSTRVTRGRLEIPFADEADLEELVEALEQAAP